MTTTELNTCDDLPPAQQLTERINDWHAPEVLVDETARLIRNVALAGLVSRNGYRYSEQALRTAVSLYAGKPVFLDHAANLARPFKRSTRDLVGSIVEPRFAEGRIRGDIQVVDTEAGRTFLALASANAPGVGMSHIVLVRKNSQGDVVEQIQNVVSVDAVVFPVTTTSLRENQHDANDNDDSIETESTCDIPSSWKATFEDMMRHWPALLRMLESSPDQSQETTGSDRNSLKTPEAEIDHLLAHSGLPEFAVTECFRQVLRNASEAMTRRQLCVDRLRLIEETRRLLPASRERLRTTTSHDELSILSTFRRQPTSVLAGYG